jgi:hypothetical protein
MQLAFSSFNRSDGCDDRNQLAAKEKLMSEETIDLPTISKRWPVGDVHGYGQWWQPDREGPKFNPQCRPVHFAINLPLSQPFRRFRRRDDSRSVLNRVDP